MNTSTVGSGFHRETLRRHARADQHSKNTHRKKKEKERKKRAFFGTFDYNSINRRRQLCIPQKKDKASSIAQKSITPSKTERERGILCLCYARLIQTRWIWFVASLGWKRNCGFLVNVNSSGRWGWPPVTEGAQLNRVGTVAAAAVANH